MINLLKIFKNLRSEEYCIIKIGEQFPNYEKSSDIDIFAKNSDIFIKKLIHELQKFIFHSEKIEIKILNKNQTHINFMVGESLELKFDVYSAMPNYKKLLIKPALFESIVEQRINKKIKVNKSVISVCVPSTTHELMLRYFEYIEWYDQVPSKIKHHDFILKNVRSDKALESLLKNIHHYTSLPDTKVKVRRKTMKQKIKESEIYHYVFSVLKIIKQRSTLTNKTKQKQG